MANPKNPFYGRESVNPKADLIKIRRMPLAETIQNAKKGNLVKRIEDMKKIYCVCSRHINNRDKYVHKITGNLAPKWVQKMLKDEEVAHEECLPCYIREHGIDKAIDEFGIDTVYEATRNMMLR